MACKAANPEELTNLVENNRAIYTLKNNQRAEETLEHLSHSRNNFVKDQSRYTVVGSTGKIDTTVTTQINNRQNKKFFRNLTDQDALRIKHQADIGNYVHDINEFIGKEILNNIAGLNSDDAIKYLDSLTYDSIPAISVVPKTIFDEYNMNLTKGAITGLFEGVKKTLRDIYARQRRINKETGVDEVPTIQFEQVVIDAQKGIGGTIDLLAIFSDNSAAVYDFKTKIAKGDNINPDGSLKSIDRVITIGDKEKYKLQLGEYTRILRERYGVKEVSIARVIPIRLNVDYNKTTKNYERLVKNAAYPGQEPLLSQITPVPEKTGFHSIDEFMSYIYKRINSLEEKAKVDKENRESLRSRAAELELGRQDFLIRHDLNTIIKYAEKLSQSFDDISNMSIGELMDSLHELKVLSMLSQSTYEYRNYLKAHNITLPSGKQGKDAADEIEAKIGVLTSQINDAISLLEEQLFEKKLVKLVEEQSGYKITDNTGRILPFNDEGFFGKYFNQLSQFENPVFKAMKSLLDSAQYDMREKLNTVIEDVQKKEGALRKWMKETGKDDKWLIDMLVDKTTDNMYSKTSKQLSDKLLSLSADEIHKYYEPQPWYKEWFDKRRKEIYDDVLARTQDQQEAEIKVAAFDKLNDLSLNSKGTPSNPDAWSRYRSFGKLKLKESIINSNLSEEYKAISKIPVLLDYYNMFVQYNKQFRQILGVDYFNLPNNFLPNIRKSAIERIQDMGLVNGMQSMVADTIQDLNVREDDMYYGEMDNGKLVRRIPRFFINPFKDENKNIIIGEKSYDFGKSLILFAKMAYNFSEMSKIEAEIVGLKELLAERGHELIKRKGKNVKDYIGNNLTANIKGSDLEDVFNSFVDAYLYGIQIQPSLLDKSGQAEKILLKAKAFFSAKALGLNFVAAAGSFIAAKTNTIIEGNKGIIYTRQDYLDSLKASYSDRSKFLAMFAYFDPMGHRIENFSITEEKKYGHQELIGDSKEKDFVRKYVNTRMLLRPFSLGDEHIDEVILSALSRNYYVDDLGNVKRMKTEQERINFKDRSIWNLFEFENNTPKLNVPDEVKKKVIISFRKAAQAAQSKIKGTIPEEDKAYWQTQIIGQIVMHFKSWLPGIIRERAGKLKYNDNLDSVEIGKYVAFGKEFTNTEGVAAKIWLKEIVAPKLLKFVTDVVTFGVFKSSLRLNDTTRKRIAFEKWLDENPHYIDKISFEEFVDVQQRQLRSMMQELRVLLIFSALMALLGGDWDDDGQVDYKQYLLTRKLAAILFKTNQEMSFVYNPVDFAKMIANPLPMLGLVTDAWKTIKNTIDETRDVTFGENSNADKTGFLYYSHQWIPGVKGISAFLDIFNKNAGEAYK